MNELSPRRVAWGLFLLRLMFGWVFLSEGIQKFLFPAALGAG
jgi:putative oxidoreductase